MNRRKAREQAFLLIFEKIFKPDETVEEIVQLRRASMMDEQWDTEFDDIETDEFTKQITDSVMFNIENLDEYIQRHSTGWDINRISKVALSILRISACEMIYIEDVPKSVSINEAVELAKAYGGDEDASFVNGVLSGIFKDLESNKTGTEQI